MSKDKSEKKEKKDKRRESEGGVKKEKKEKKSRKSLDVSEVVAVDADGDVVIDESVADIANVVATTPLAALVAFANPLADDKSGKKVLKSVKKAAKAKCLKRGVKEVVKAVRKSPPGNPTTPASALPPGIVVLAADISPMDVISHIPVLCEDHNIPYVFLPSRAELGAAGSTKRPTSVVMVTPKAGGAKQAEKADADEDWSETYADLNKLVGKIGQYVKV
ncbi:L30e-like protein [Myriangium duriaei CBS 260.36]|uniref:L30e-like protein n=1 Tax=Myriangium duriaei CBS 260.36 TaxID=1168546 RepID=A0A9P4J6D8_9PEZI|nr:L30e-like protein [Myriangium duriaei CBS 260.36]